MRHQAIGRYTFDADFDSGNCARVEQAGGPDEFDLWTAADCAGTSIATEAKTWFHFSVSGGAPGDWITITIHNMNGQNRLYKHDHRPVYRNGTDGIWQRIKLPVRASGSKERDNFQITFRHRFDSAQGEPTFFAFCYPWSYAEGQALLDEIEAKYGASLPAAAGGDALAEGTDSGEELGSVREKLGALGAPDTLGTCAGDIYFRRELLATSIEGRRIDLLTITSASGLGGAREPPLGSHGCAASSGSATYRPHTFADRPVFVVSARVHPGEVPASHVLNGFLAFALRADDPRARALRETFVLKLIPCLNPDGVFHGHYRLDTRGVNLNRCYSDPDPVLHPAIHATRALLSQLHSRGVLALHVDMHGHATKRGCFLFGNYLPDARQQAEAVLYAKLASLNSQTVDFDGCVFGTPGAGGADREKGEAQSKEGASRVAIYRMTGAAHCYTLECNYNMGRVVNKLAEPLGGRALSPRPIPAGAVAPKYSPETWAEVGRALAVAALDLRGANPLSRLAAAGGGSRLDAVRGWCQAYAHALAKRTQQQRQRLALAGQEGGTAGEGASGGEDGSANDENEDDGAARGRARRAKGGGAAASAAQGASEPPAQPRVIERAASSLAVLSRRGAAAAPAAARAPAGRANAAHASAGAAAALGKKVRALRLGVDLPPAPNTAAPLPPRRLSANSRQTSGGLLDERLAVGGAKANSAAAATVAPAGAVTKRRANSLGPAGAASSLGLLAPTAIPKPASSARSSSRASVARSLVAPTGSKIPIVFSATSAARVVREGRAMCVPVT